MNDYPDAPETLSQDARDRLRAIATQLIPNAYDMPAAGAILTDTLIDFVLGARPDLTARLNRGLRPELAHDAVDLLEHLADNDPDALQAVHLAVVAGYYADHGVRKAIGYPGQVARPVNALEFPAYIDEGLIDAVVRRGPLWRDPDSTAAAN